MAGVKPRASQILPAIFFGHGNLIYAAIQIYTEAWRRIGANLPRRSAHRLNATDQSLDAGRGASKEEGSRLAVLQVIRMRKPQCRRMRSIIALSTAPRAVAPYNRWQGLAEVLNGRAGCAGEKPQRAKMLAM
jgi:hypothetical protein